MRMLQVKSDDFYLRAVIGSVNFRTGMSPPTTLPYIVVLMTTPSCYVCSNPNSIPPELEGELNHQNQK